MTVAITTVAAIGVAVGVGCLSWPVCDRVNAWHARTPEGAFRRKLAALRRLHAGPYDIEAQR